MFSLDFLKLRAIDEQTADLRARNIVRAEAFKVAMGTKHVLHPQNSPKKIKRGAK